MVQNIKIAVALGANLGDRLATLRRAANRLSHDLLLNSRSSSVYESDPWGILEQPKFLNAVLVGDCEWKPPAIVNFLKQLELELGRKPGPRFGPREIDLDLIAYGNEVWESPGVVVPHPEMAKREFVLAPLNELWGDWQHPRLLCSVHVLCQSLFGSEPQHARFFAPPLQDTRTP